MLLGKLLGLALGGIVDHALNTLRRRVFQALC